MAVIEPRMTVLVEVGDHPAAQRDGDEVVILPVGSSDVCLSVGRADLQRWMTELGTAVENS